MARSIKKVKKPHTKKFWIILSSCLAFLVVGIIVGLFVWYILANTATLTKRFAGEDTQYKINYNEIEDLLDESKENEYKEVFVFVYNDTFVFDKPKGKKTTTAYQTYEKYQQGITELHELIELVNLANSCDSEGNYTKRDDGLKTGIFICDASLSGNSNVDANEDYDSITSPGLLGFYMGAQDSSLSYVKTSSTIEGKNSSGQTIDYTISGGSTIDSFLSTIKEVQEYIMFTYGVSLEAQN